MTAPAPFFDRLEAVRSDRGSILCVGIDPRLERMPAEITDGADGDVETILTRFGTELLELAGPHAACFKPQIAFFEAHGMRERTYTGLVWDWLIRNRVPHTDWARSTPPRG